MSSLDEISGLRPELCTAMQRRGFTALTAVQQAVLDSEAEGRNLRISSQTGSGKTVAIGFALADDLLDNPAPQAPGPVALLITPTRELAAQVQGELKWLLGETDLNVGVVTGGTDVMRERRRLAKRPHILVGTPGRVLDHLRSGAFKCAAVRHVILDEADQMLDMGFRDELSAIVEQMPEVRRSHLVSATFPTRCRASRTRSKRTPCTWRGHSSGWPTRTSSTWRTSSGTASSTRRW